MRSVHGIEQTFAPSIVDLICELDKRPRPGTKVMVTRVMRAIWTGRFTLATSPLVGSPGNHGRWVALTAVTVARSVTLPMQWPSIERASCEGANRAVSVDTVGVRNASYCCSCHRRIGCVVFGNITQVPPAPISH